MDKSVEKKYVILFAILIALTGFTFESQSGAQPGNTNNADSSVQLQISKVNHLP